MCVCVRARAHSRTNLVGASGAVQVRGAAPAARASMGFAAAGDDALYVFGGWGAAGVCARAPTDKSSAHGRIECG